MIVDTCDYAACAKDSALSGEAIDADGHDRGLVEVSRLHLTDSHVNVGR